MILYSYTKFSTDRPTFAVIEAPCRSLKRILSHHKVLKRVSKDDKEYKHCNKLYKDEKVRQRRLLSLFRIKEGWSRDRQLKSFLSKLPSTAYRILKRSKVSRTQKVGILKVGNMTYHGRFVPNGIFESIRRLKSDPFLPNSDPSLMSNTSRYLIFVSLEGEFQY